jgi:hypothetical protein
MVVLSDREQSMIYAAAAPLAAGSRAAFIEAVLAALADNPRRSGKVRCTAPSVQTSGSSSTRRPRLCVGYGTGNQNDEGRQPAHH